MRATSVTDSSRERLIARAQDGDREALERLLHLHRNYLSLLARTQMGSVLKLRLDASDLVQETFLEACRDFQGFSGTSERQLLVWLRRILIRNLVDHTRRQFAERRDCRRAESLEAMLDRSSLTVYEALGAGSLSPSAQVSRKEQTVLLADALFRLPEDYREVIFLRHFDRLPFDDIAARLHRSSGAVRMLWVRAIERLRRELEELS